MRTVNATEIERFVRGTLGCGCPDEVFLSMSIRQVRPVGRVLPHTELLVGSRLLIQVLEAPQQGDSPGWLEQVVGDGRAARDRHGYNRYRLVLVVPASVGPTTDRDDLGARFARASAGDERAHLHLLTRDQLPPSLRPPSISASAANSRT
jgi:hypothetical protein